MNDKLDFYPDHQLLNYGQLRGLFSDRHKDYATAAPFPHIILDSFIDPELIEVIIQNFPAPQNQADGEPIGEAPKLFELHPTLRQLLWEFNSSTFIRVLEGLTGIDDLIPDPRPKDAGVCQAQAGAIEPISALPTHNQRYGLERRIRLELFLNSDWPDEHQGHLELWNADINCCVKRIRPTAGRCIIFSTTCCSYHGQSQALACPDNNSRKSIVVNYYTLQRDTQRPSPQLSESDLGNELNLPPLQ